MEIVYLNDVNQTIKDKIADAVMLSNFADLNSKVGIYESAAHENLMVEGRNTPACTVPKEDAEANFLLNPELSEIRDYFADDVDTIIWFCGSAHSRVSLKKIVLHELRHIEQRLTESDAFIKDRACNCLLKDVAPIEIDADEFASQVAGGSYYENSDWVSEAEELFEKHKANIKKLYEALVHNRNEVITIDEENVIVVNNLTDDQKQIGLHFFGKAVQLMG